MAPRRAAAALEISASTLHRIEAGQVSMRALDVEGMCRLYGAAPELTEALMALAKETRNKGWWHSYGDAIPRWFGVYVGLETAASHLRKYCPNVIPGLAQTKDYATAILRLDDSGVSEEEFERRVAVRLERQGLLTRRLPHAPQLDIVLSEVALHQTLDDRQAMAEQMRLLNEVGSLPNVSIRILPGRVGLHRATDVEAFTILDFPDSGSGRAREPSIVYSEGLTGALYLDKPAEVRAYGDVWNETTGICLTESESRQLITTTTEEYDAK
jgi:hypothetical protein